MAQSNSQISEQCRQRIQDPQERSLIEKELSSISREFFDIMGREPGQENPENALDPIDYVENITQILTQIGLEPAYIHAFQQTGVLFTGETTPPEDVSDTWREAVEEYLKQNPTPKRYLLLEGVATRKTDTLYQAITEAQDAAAQSGETIIVVDSKAQEGSPLARIVYPDTSWEIVADHVPDEAELSPIFWRTALNDMAAHSHIITLRSSNDPAVSHQLQVYENAPGFEEISQQHSLGANWGDWQRDFDETRREVHYVLTAHDETGFSGCLSFTINLEIGTEGEVIFLRSFLGKIFTVHEDYSSPVKMALLSTAGKILAEQLYRVKFDLSEEEVHLQPSTRYSEKDIELKDAVYFQSAFFGSVEKFFTSFSQPKYKH